MNQDEEDLFASLEGTFRSVEAESIRPLTDFDNMELVNEKSGAEIRLVELEQVLHPYTQEARDLHSRLNALTLEIDRRERLGIWLHGTG